jgi:outer membrane protein TolC
MKTFQIKLSLLLLVLFCRIIPSQSQQPFDSLEVYLKIAVNNNPEIIQKYNEYLAALKKIPQAGTLPEPEFNAGVYLKPMEQVSGNQIADLKLMQMFPWFGVLKYGKDEMSQMANTRLARFNDTRLQVLYDVQRSWFEIGRIRNSISISDKNVEILRNVEKMAVVKFKFAAVPSASGLQNIPVSGSMSPSVSGYAAASDMQTMGGTADAPQSGASAQSAAGMQTSAMGSSGNMSGLSDVYRIQMEIAEIQDNISGLKTQVSAALARFNGYLNRSPGTPVYTPELSATDTLSFPVMAWNDSLLKKNPMLQKLEYEKKSVEARQKMINRMGYPMVGLGLDYSVISKSNMSNSRMNGKDMLMPMVSVTLPIYRKKYRAMAEEAELTKTSTVNNYEATENGLRTEYFQAVQQFDDALRRARLYDSQIQLATKTFEIMLKSFSGSAASLTDLLRIRQQTYDYQLKRVDALADHNIAKATIHRLTGIAILK